MSTPHVPWGEADHGWTPEGGWRPDEPTVAVGRGGRPAPRRRGKLPLVIGIAVVVLAVAAVLAFLWPGFLVFERFDQQALEAGVAKILTEDYGLGVTGVACPDDQTVSADATFTCRANVDGEQVDVPIRVLDDQGTYQVARV